MIATVDNSQTSEVTQPVTTPDLAEKTASSSAGFEATLKSFLKSGPAEKVSEEELFSALIGERLSSVKGSDVATKYQQALDKAIETTRAPDGYVLYEKAAGIALKDLTASGDLTEEEASGILSQSFKAAQLDSNTEALYDSRGGEGDPTIAVETMEIALMNAKAMIESFEAGDGAGSMDLDYVPAGKPGAGSATTGPSIVPDGGPVIVGDVIAPDGNVVDGANNFLFKPISENEGTLAVLLTSAMAHNVAEVLLKDENGDVIEKGRSTGYGDTGEREKFSFSKEGGEYPDNLTVEVVMNDGRTQQYSIPDPSQRYD